jgi:hypothetical protein
MTALLFPSFSAMHPKNWAFAMPMVIGVERRHILRKGSSKFSNEPALAETKHFEKRLRYKSCVWFARLYLHPSTAWRTTQYNLTVKRVRTTFIWLDSFSTSE